MTATLKYERVRLRSVNWMGHAEVILCDVELTGPDPVRQGRERRAQANCCRSVESGLGDVKTGG